MSTTQASGAPSALRREIENALRGTRLAASARWLASQLSRSAWLVRTELEAMAREGLLHSRTNRSGDVLYSVTRGGK